MWGLHLGKIMKGHYNGHIRLGMPQRILFLELHILFQFSPIIQEMYGHSVLLHLAVQFFTIIVAILAEVLWQNSMRMKYRSGALR